MLFFFLEDVYIQFRKKHTTMDNGNEELCRFVFKNDFFLPFRSAFVVKTQFLAAVGKNTMETFASKNPPF